MASQTSRIIEDLAGAVLDLNDALSSVHDGGAERTALERFVRILRKTVDHRSLWTELEGHATGAGPLDARVSAESILMLISTALGDVHADLLDRCGYRVPPPPPAERLIEQTRQAVLWGDRRPRWGRRHVQEAHGELDTFVSRLESALRDGARLRGWSFRARQVGVCGLLLLLAGHLELKPGDDISVEVSLSLKDKIKVAVTLPAPWVGDEEDESAARAVVVNSQASNLGETIALTRFDGEAFDYDAIPREWRSAWIHRWYVERSSTAEAVRDARERALAAMASWEEEREREQAEWSQWRVNEDSRYRDDGHAL